MFLDIEQRTSESPYIDRVWRSRSNGGGSMISIASTSWDLVGWELADQVHVTVHGPETRATEMQVPAGATFFGISFALGTSIPRLRTAELVDRAIEIPDVAPGSFRFAGRTWQRPDDESAEAFAERLFRRGELTFDPLVAEVVPAPNWTRRTVQRRFRAATGLTPGAVRQIDRARRAALFLRQGAELADVMTALDYYDGPHLRRSLTRFIGRRPSQLRQTAPADQLSLLYTT